MLREMFDLGPPGQDVYSHTKSLSKQQRVNSTFTFPVPLTYQITTYSCLAQPLIASLCIAYQTKLPNVNSTSHHTAYHYWNCKTLNTGHHIKQHPGTTSLGSRFTQLVTSSDSMPDSSNTLLTS